MNPNFLFSNIVRIEYQTDDGCMMKGSDKND